MARVGRTLFAPRFRSGNLHAPRPGWRSRGFVTLPSRQTGREYSMAFPTSVDALLCLTSACPRGCKGAWLEGQSCVLIVMHGVLGNEKHRVGRVGYRSRLEDVMASLVREQKPSSGHVVKRRTRSHGCVLVGFGSHPIAAQLGGVAKALRHDCAPRRRCVGSVPPMPNQAVSPWANIVPIATRSSPSNAL